MIILLLCMHALGIWASSCTFICANRPGNLTGSLMWFLKWTTEHAGWEADESWAITQCLIHTELQWKSGRSFPWMFFLNIPNRMKAPHIQTFILCYLDCVLVTMCKMHIFCSSSGCWNSSTFKKAHPAIWKTSRRWQQWHRNRHKLAWLSFCSWRRFLKNHSQQLWSSPGLLTADTCKTSPDKTVSQRRNGIQMHWNT